MSKKVEIDPGHVVLDGENKIAQMVEISADALYMRAARDTQIAASMLSLIDRRFGEHEFQVTFATNLALALTGRILAVSIARLGVTEQADVDKITSTFSEALVASLPDLIERARALVAHIDAEGDEIAEKVQDEIAEEQQVVGG